MPIDYDKPSLNYALEASQRLAFMAQLGAVIPADRLLWQPEAVKPYECDGLAAYQQQPLAVVLASSEEDVRQTLLICHAFKVPVVTRGGGTSLSAGATPHPQGVVLSVARMNRIESLDPLARIAVVEAGIRNAAVSEAASAHGLYYAPDPSSQIACTLGGNVAENSGGVHCLKYGLTVHNVIGVAGFTAQGEPIQIGGHALDSQSGPDLLALLHGSEGLLAVVTKVWLRLLPKPALAQVLLAAFPTIHSAAEAVAAVIANGIIPAGLEMMDQATTRAVEPFVKVGYPLDAAAILLCESDGLPAEVAEEINAVEAIMRQCGASHIRVSQSEAERLLLWSGRKGAFPAVGRMTPDYYCMDGSIPRRFIATMLESIADLEKKHGLTCVNVFHAGDGNLHPLILYDSDKAGELEKAEEFGADILELSIALGGSITGEHGVGLEKINQMCHQFSIDEISIFHGIKNAFDHKEILNPGKAIPTLHRCAELGAMHVHHGHLPHADIPRF